ncbi:MAG: PKD domain-containing protein [Myxococcales bacterium]
MRLCLLAVFPLTAAACLVFVVSGPGTDVDAGPALEVSLPDGGVGYRLPDGGLTDSLVEPVCHANPTSGPPGTQVTFDGQDSQGSPGAVVVTWAWSFGDGTAGGGALTSHVYQDAGTFQAVLTATDDSGASGSTACPAVTLSP